MQYNETEVAKFSVIWLTVNPMDYRMMWGGDLILCIGCLLVFLDKGVALKNGARWTQAGKGWGLSGLNQKVSPELFLIFWLKSACMV